MGVKKSTAPKSYPFKDFESLVRFMSFTGFGHSYNDLRLFASGRYILLGAITALTRNAIGSMLMSGKALNAITGWADECFLKHAFVLTVVSNTPLAEVDSFIEYLSTQNTRDFFNVMRVLNIYCRMDERRVLVPNEVESQYVSYNPPTEEEKERAAADWLDLLKKDRIILGGRKSDELIDFFDQYLLLNPLYSGFLTCLSFNPLLRVFFHRYDSIVDYFRFISPEEEKMAFDLLDNAVDKEDDAVEVMRDEFLLYNDYLQQGNAAELVQRVAPGNTVHTVLSAILLLEQGRNEEAYLLLDRKIKSLGADLYSDDFCNFIYLIALLKSTSDKSLTKAASLLKKRAIKVNTASRVNYLLLHLKVYPQADYTDFVKNHPLDGHRRVFELMVFPLLCRYFHIPNSTDLYPDAAYSSLINRKLYALAVHFSNEFDPLFSQKYAEKNLKPLLPEFKQVPEWEKVLDGVLVSFTKPTATTKKKVAGKELSRVVYHVAAGNGYYSVQPRLQKSKDDGATWSAGRNIALTTFQKGVDGMTDQDRIVATHVKAYSVGWYGSTSYDLEGPAVIESLIGHPLVFSAYNPNEKMEILEEKLTLQVLEVPNGFKVQTNLGGEKNYKNLMVIQENDRTLKVVRLTTAQKELLKNLDRVIVFPKEAKEKLIQLLEALSDQVTVMSALLKNSQHLTIEKGSPLLVVQLLPYNEMFQVRCYVKPLVTCAPYCTPGNGMAYMAATRDGKPVQIERDLKAEKKNLKMFISLMEPFDEYQTEDGWLLDTVACLQVLDHLRQHPETCILEWPEGVRLSVKHASLTGENMNLSVKGSLSTWFEVDGEIRIDKDLTLKLNKLLEQVRHSQGNFIQIGDTEYVAISQQLKKQLQALDQIAQEKHAKLQVSSFNTGILDGMEESGVHFSTDSSYKQLRENISAAGKLEIKKPKGLTATLRDYQWEGFCWLTRLSHWTTGACLADDMGLGKTIQTIALLLSRLEKGPSLVVMPTSVLLNWKDELKKFAPSLEVYMLKDASNRNEQIAKMHAGQILLCTYGLLQTEEDSLATMEWNTVVFDEAHVIKNKETKTSKAAMKLKAAFRLVLTGTPLQNHLGELWNLFQFATPGLLGSFPYFTERFIIPIEREKDKDRQRMLKRILSPFILRRTKDDVLNELPEKTEITLKVELSPMERTLYERLRENAVMQLGEGSTSPIQALAELTRLRQAACNAALVLPAKEAKAIPSAKMETFLTLVNELMENNHRALVFSQFTTHLALIRKELDQQQIPYLYLDGSVSPQERIKLVQEFQQGEMPLFLISLKAGGLGLNLTSADYVIHMDPWWNPAIENQASDRAYRIGQEHAVTVYRLIASATIEEKILALHQTKKSLADALLEGSDMNHTLGKDEILALLMEK